MAFHHNSNVMHDTNMVQEKCTLLMCDLNMFVYGLQLTIVDV